MKGEIKYSYCIDENDCLIHIKDITPKEIAKHHYTCLECGNVMHPRLGKIKTPHFAHNPGVSCHGESYLHKLAKRRIMEHFASSRLFKLQQRHDVSCASETYCAFFNDHLCYGNNYRLHNLKEFYNTCEEEIRIYGFIADLLLTNSDKIGREPVLIEVLVTHACEEQKTESGLKIIETKRIDSESDIDDIILNGFVEGENCILHNFKHLPSIQLGKRPIDRFILHATGGATTQIINCESKNNKVKHDSIAELNINRDVLWDKMRSKDSVLTGLIYLKHKGLDIKNCLLCKYFCLHRSFFTPLCTLYKKFGTPESPKQTTAKQCQYYSISYKILNEIDSKLLYEVVKELE